jgi:Ser/Thr protein kinase RdoA (MazF antagonist)
MVFEKRRRWAPAGSIPHALSMFESEVRFYREVAPEVGVRVPACIEAIEGDEGTLLRLEDLSSWLPGADPVSIAVELQRLHRRWEGRALDRWPWLRPPGAAATLIGELYDDTWPRLATRADIDGPVRKLGQSLVGAVEAAEHAEGTAGPLTLCHGDASIANVATGPSGEIAFLDWEDVRWAAGVTDLAWLLVSSVPPTAWDAVIGAYGDADLEAVLPSVAAQGLFALSDLADGSAEALPWVERLSEAACRLDH